MTRRPGFLVYGLLTAFVLGSAMPLWWSFIIGSHTKEIVNRDTPPLLPGGHFLANAARVFDTVDFWKALTNSMIVSTVCAASVVFFCTLAGFAFAKLRFRGSTPLMVFVVATLAVPTQLGVIPLFILMAELGWTGTLWAVIVPTLVTAFGVFFMRQYLVDAVVVVARHVPVVAVGDGVGHAAEGVPDRRQAAVLGGGALDLVRRSGGAPEEVGREADCIARGLQDVGAGGGVGHPLTAPCMMPATSWRPVRTNRTSSGIVESTAPQSTRA